MVRTTEELLRIANEKLELAHARDETLLAQVKSMIEAIDGLDTCKSASIALKIVLNRINENIAEAKQIERVMG